MLAVATLLFAACNEDDFQGNGNGNEVEAAFSLELPFGMATRAVGDGSTVDKVKCAVYADGEELTELTAVVDVNADKTATYNVRLIKGRAYRVVFFAYNEAANAYNVEDLKNITFNGNPSSNVESRDAFTAFVDVTAKETLNALSKSVTLKRPFAQLNIGSTAADTEAARKAAGIAAGEKVLNTSSVKVTGVYNTFDAYESGATGDEAEMVFDLNAVPEEMLTVNGEEYTYAAFNYILAGDKATTTVTFNWVDTKDNTNAEPTVWTNVPLQRNYRTNIIGSVLTNPAEFIIKIDAAFAGENNVFVAHCPSSNMNLSSGIAPIRKYLT